MSTETNYVRVIMLGLFTSLAMISCVAGGSTDGTAETDSSTATTTAVTTPWSPDTPTTGVPTFGKNCRYTADSVYSVSSNQAPDDSLTLTIQEGGASLSLKVLGDGGSVLEATNIQLEQGLKDKSYRNATGAATWSSSAKTGEVVDGAFCLSGKLDSGTDLEAEFSLVMKLPDGSFESVSGSLSIPQESISSTPSPSVNATNLSIAL